MRRALTREGLAHRLVLPRPPDRQGRHRRKLRVGPSVVQAVPPVQYPEVVEPLPPHPVHRGGKFGGARSGRPPVGPRVRPYLLQFQLPGRLYEEDRRRPYRLLGARLHPQPVPVDDRHRVRVPVQHVQRVEVAVHPAGRRDVGGGRPVVGVLLQQGAPLDEAVFGELVEGVPGAPAARRGQQIVDQGERVGGVRAGMSARLGHPLSITCASPVCTAPRSAPSRCDWAVVSWAPTRCSPSTQGCRA